MTRLAIPLLLLALTAAPALAAKAPRAAAVTPPADPVPGLLDQARDAQGRGDGQLALRLAQSAIVADPARPSSYVALGDIYAAQGQAGFARSYYDEAIAIDPQEPSALKAIAALESHAKAVATTAQ